MREMVEFLTAKAITFDIDWAPDFMIAECMDICAKAGVPASFYATHPSPVLKEIDEDSRFELGIHPNFLPQSSHGANYHDVLSYCIDLAPRATSIRTHSLYQNSRMFHQLMHSFPQIRVDASLFLPGHPNLRATDLHFGPDKILRRLPFFWEDDVYAEHPDANWSDPPASTPGLNIFAFHPVHVSVNTGRISTYNKMRDALPLSQWTREFVDAGHNQNAGTGSFLRQLVTAFPASDFLTITDMADRS